MHEIEKKLKEKLSDEDFKDFYFNEYAAKPNACGCINVAGGWYIYPRQDEHCYAAFTGPFDDSSIVYACAWLLEKEDVFKEFESEDFLKTYLHSHFYSIEAIKKSRR